MPRIPAFAARSARRAALPSLVLCALAAATALTSGCAARALARDDAEVLAELPPDTRAPSHDAHEPSGAAAAPAPPNDRDAELAEVLEPGRVAAERAALTLALEDLAAAERALDAALALAPRSPWAQYQRAFAAHARMLACLHGQHRAAAGEFDAAASAAVKHARAALALSRERPAEAAALLASIQGLRIAADGWLGMSLGPECDTLLELAERSEAENPRVVLVRGIELWNKPALFGGDRDAARAKFAHARELFARGAGSAGAGEPRWGAADACAWHGLALVAQGDLVAARQAYEEACAIAPEYGWIRKALLPELERREQAR